LLAKHSFVVALLYGLIWFGAGRTQEQELAAEPQIPPKLTIEVSRTQVSLRGDVSSIAHESILRQRTQKLFPRKKKSFELRERPALPPGWALLSELALHAAVETYSSVTEITPSLIHIRGIAGDASMWRAEISRMEEKLPNGMRLEHELSEIRSTGSLERQCTSLFQNAMRERKIEFPRAGATLGTGASPFLDELIQIVADCPAARITITGHTDRTGSDTGNIALSKTRAEAVADYMREGGIAADRITVVGGGSSRPIVTEDSRQARQLNRRIEIEMFFLPR